jgi:hypothetical protein
VYSVSQLGPKGAHLVPGGEQQLPNAMMVLEQIAIVKAVDSSVRGAT